MKKHWYLIESHECPVCGRGRQYRTRVYKKPKASSHWTFVVDYDYCLERER